MSYDRGTVMMVSRARQLEVAGLCVLAWLVSGRLFLLGGLLATLLVVGVMFLWARRQR